MSVLNVTVKVIFLYIFNPGSYIFQVLYVLRLSRPRYQVSVYRTIGPLVKTFFPTSQEAPQKILL